MTHHPEHDHAAAGKSRFTGFLKALSVVVLLIAVIIAAFRFSAASSPTQSEDAARSAEREKNLADLRSADQASTGTYGWTDRAKGIVRIPVTRAMELVIPELNARAVKPAASTNQQP